MPNEDVERVAACIVANLLRSSVIGGRHLQLDTIQFQGDLSENVSKGDIWTAYRYLRSGGVLMDHAKGGEAGDISIEPGHLREAIALVEKHYPGKAERLRNMYRIGENGTSGPDAQSSGPDYVTREEALSLLCGYVAENTFRVKIADLAKSLGSQIQSLRKEVEMAPSRNGTSPNQFVEKLSEVEKGICELSEKINYVQRDHRKSILTLIDVTRTMHGRIDDLTEMFSALVETTVFLLSGGPRSR